jgi:ankyrin repeat protein
LGGTVITRAFTIASVLLLTACQSTAPQDRAIDYLALYYAADGRNQLLVEALLERGAPVDAPDVNSAGMLSAQAVNFDSPLQVAARNGDLEIVRLLLKHRPWVDHRCCDGPAALGYAAEAGHAEIVQELLDAGADPSIVSNYDRDLQGTPLDAARQRGHTAVVELLKHAKNESR